VNHTLKLFAPVGARDGGWGRRGVSPGPLDGRRRVAASVKLKAFGGREKMALRGCAIVKKSSGRNSEPSEGYRSKFGCFWVTARGRRGHDVEQGSEILSIGTSETQESKTFGCV